MALPNGCYASIRESPIVWPQRSAWHQNQGRDRATADGDRLTVTSFGGAAGGLRAGYCRPSPPCWRRMQQPELRCPASAGGTMRRPGSPWAQAGRPPCANRPLATGLGNRHRSADSRPLRRSGQSQRLAGRKSALSGGSLTGLVTCPAPGAKRNAGSQIRRVVSLASKGPAYRSVAMSSWWLLVPVLR
jgi:hypothetical protein